MARIGWFSSARGPGSRGLFQTVIDQINAGNIRGNIEFVFCTQEPGESENSDIFFDMVNRQKIPVHYLSSRKFNASWPIPDNTGREEALDRRRIAYDREVMKLLKPYNPDFCMLAGYMLIVGYEMCTHYNMINLHPALPGGPKGTWHEVIWELIETRARESGVMMHLATPDLDRGPVVTYCTYPIVGEAFDALWHTIEGLTTDQIKADQGEEHPLFKTIRKHGYARELPLIVLTLQHLCDNKVRIESGNIFDESGKPVNGYNLTSEVDIVLPND